MTTGPVDVSDAPELPPDPAPDAKPPAIDHWPIVGAEGLPDDVKNGEPTNPDADDGTDIHTEEPAMDAPTLQMLTTVAGITIAVAAIEAFLLPALSLTEDANNRIGPLLAVVLGIAVGVLATWVVVTGVGKQDIASAVVNGIFGGLAAVGTHQFVKKTILAKPAS